MNATFPVFLLIVLGYLLRRLGIVGEHFVKEGNKFNFTVTLPVLLFKDLMATDIAQGFRLDYVLFCAFATTVSFFAIWIVCRVTVKNRVWMGEFVQASFRCSVAVMGIAFVQNMYGSSGMAPMMIIGTVPLLNVYSVLVLTVEAENGQSFNKKEKIKKSVIGIVKNPIIIGIVLGILAALVHLRLPVILEKGVGYVANLATPLALICLGAGFEGKKALAKIRPTIVASVVKLLVLPAVFLPLAVWMGYRGEYMAALIIMLASPTTPSCYIMAKNMGHDGVLTSSVIVATTLLASVTLTFWIYIMKVLGII